MNKQKKARLKKFYIIIVMVIVFCALGFLYKKMRNHTAGEEVMRINGQPVYSEEIRFAAEKVKLKKREELVKKAGIDINEFDWNTEVEGKSGYEYLAESVTLQLAAVKVMQIEAMNQELIDEIAYPALMQAMEQENSSRKKKKQDGGAVFGLTEFNASQYYDYFNENLSLGNKRELIKTGTLAASEEESKAAYDQNLDYFDNQAYETVRNAAKNFVLEEKYNVHIDEMAEKAQIDIPDEKIWIESVKKAING